MTFTEAAAKVLRLVGKPLHYKEITDVAIEKNFLSHVGKSPEVTMGARLAALVKKGDKENPLVRVKPGVFALREWDQATIDQGLADRTPALERLSEADTDDDLLEAAHAPNGMPDVETSSEEEVSEIDEEERRRAEFAAGAQELFAPEADDDEPILGGDTDVGEEDDDRQREGRRRRRRRRRGRDGESRSGDDLPSYTVSDAPLDTEALLPTETKAPEPERPERRDRADRDRNDRERERNDRERERNDRERGDRDRRGAPEKVMTDLAGRELADAVYQLLTGYDRNRGPVSVQSLVDTAQRRGRLPDDAGLGQALIVAAVRADNLRLEGQGARARFRVAGARIALTEWLLDGELARLEKELFAVANRYREACRRSLLKQLQELPPRALGELVVLLMEKNGLSELAPVRRPGAPGPELHLSGKVSSAAGTLRGALVVRRDGREIGRERVTELRGTLHHYGPAQVGWIITTGQVLSGAREESAAAAASPVNLIDGLGLARLCEEHHVGVVETRITLPLPDIDLLEALRSS